MLHPDAALRATSVQHIYLILEFMFYFGSPLEQKREWHTWCCIFKEEIEHEITQPSSIFQSHQELDVHL